MRRTAPRTADKIDCRCHRWRHSQIDLRLSQALSLSRWVGWRRGCRRTLPLQSIGQLHSSSSRTGQMKMLASDYVHRPHRISRPMNQPFESWKVERQTDGAEITQQAIRIPIGIEYTNWALTLPIGHWPTTHRALLTDQRSEIIEHRTSNIDQRSEHLTLGQQVDWPSFTCILHLWLINRQQLCVIMQKWKAIADWVRILNVATVFIYYLPNALLCYDTLRLYTLD